jgi:2-polyprenyl-3-methyl-5-hydroxy-6-metoxy-1,4-benzoquinol methylase
VCTLRNGNAACTDAVGESVTQDFQMAYHYGDDYGEWGSAPRRPLVAFDGAHKGEWMDSVVGPDVFTGKPMVYHIIRCELCICTHAWPLPCSELLSQYYRDIFFQKDKPDYVERYERDREWWERCVHGPILDTCEQYLDMEHHIAENVPPRFLDIGAGPGIALDCALRRGWDTMGIEPNAWLCDALRDRGHYMRHGILEQFGDTAFEIFYGETETKRQKFDVLMAYEVLEHQECPEEFLLRCYDLLEVGGIIAVVVPNDYSPIQIAAQKKLRLPSYWLAPPQHLFYFTPKTLQLLVRRCGFSIRMMRGTFPLDKFLLQDYNYIGNERIGRLVHTWRMQDELHAVRNGQWAQREQEYTMNITQRIGREIVCIAQKVS